MNNYLIKFTNMRSGDVSYHTFQAIDLQTASLKARKQARRWGYLCSVYEADAA